MTASPCSDRVARLEAAARAVLHELAEQQTCCDDCHKDRVWTPAQQQLRRALGS